MSDRSDFPPRSKVRYREGSNIDNPENGGPIGEVIEVGPHPDPSKVFISWPSGRDAWEFKDNLEMIADEETYNLRQAIDGLDSKSDS